MPGHLVQVMGPQLTPEPSLSLVLVALGRYGGSLLLCGIGTCFVLILSPPAPVQRKPLLDVLVSPTGFCVLPK